MRFSAALWGLLAVTLLNSCAKTNEISLDRLDQTLFAAKSPEQIRAFLAKNPTVAQLYLRPDDATTDSVRSVARLVADLHHRVNDPELNVLYEQVQAEFPANNDLAKQLGEAVLLRDPFLEGVRVERSETDAAPEEEAFARPHLDRGSIEAIRRLVAPVPRVLLEVRGTGHPEHERDLR